MKFRAMPLASVVLGLGLLLAAIFAQSAAAATATTEAASGVTAFDATLNGSVNPQGKSTTWQFEYGTTTSYGKKAPVEAKVAGGGTTAVKVSESIGLTAQTVSLLPHTTYHYRLVAISGGVTVNGEDKTFTTQRLIGAPTFAFSVGSKGAGDGQFNGPRGIAVGPDGSVWVSDFGNNRIEKFNSAGEFQCKIGSTGTGNGQFRGPRNIAVDPRGNAWVADSANARVQEIGPECNYLFQFSNLEMFWPTGIAIHPSGDLLVADAECECVLRFTISGALVSKTATGNVEAVTADQFGAVWTSEPEFSRRFREYKLGGELLHTFTGAESGHYALAYGMAFDSLGNLWLPYGGTSGGEVDAFYSEGDFLLKFGEFGSGPGQLSGPQGVAIAPDGSIWVTDFGNNRIEKWTPAAQPAVVTGAAKNTLPTGTIMTGYVNPQGVATSYQFEWGTTPALGNVTEEHAIGSGTAPVSVDQGGPALLTPNTTYYYTVKSISEKGVIYGEMRHFTTAAK